MSGTFCKLICHPIDTIKARVQVNNSVLDLNPQNLKKNSMFRLTSQIIRNEGPKALFAGVGISAIMGGPGSMLYWYTFEKSKYY